MKKICKNVLPDINLFDGKTVFVVGIALIIFSVIIGYFLHLAQLLLLNFFLLIQVHII